MPNRSRRTCRVSKRWRTALRFSVTAVLLAYLGHKLDWAKFERQLLNSDPVWLLIAAILLGATFLLASVRWWLLLRVHEIALPLGIVIALTFIGQFFNSFMLGSIGGDLVKVFYALKFNPNRRTYVAVSVVMDRGMGLLVVLCCALAALSWQFGFAANQANARSILVVLLLFLLVGLLVSVALILTPFHRLPARLHRLWQRLPQHHVGELFVDGLRHHLNSPRLIAGAAACSVGVQFIVVTAGYCISRSIALEATYFEMLAAMSVVTCIVSLPISIGGHGIREGAFVIMFAMLGVISVDHRTGAGEEPAIVFSVLLFALLSIWSLLGGLVYLAFKQIR